MDAVKSSIKLISKHHFGGITVRHDHLRLGFISDERLDDDRIVKTQQLGPNRVAHAVLLRNRGDVDTTLLRWLKQAYDLQSR